MEQQIELTEDFKKTFEIMEGTNKSLLITGKAGTGKSTLLTYFTNKTKKRVVVCAPTGIAAINVGGQTIHSLFRFPPKILDYWDIKKLPGQFYKKIDVIIIDEISMVRADMFDAIDLFMRLNGKDALKPFGGVQMIFFGDLYQLPPVVENETEGILQKIYKSPYFFDSKVMNGFSFNIVNLTKVFRQKDPNFIEFLDKVRLGNIDTNTLELINKKISSTNIDEEFVTLTPTNKIANSINQNKLNKINHPLYTYKAELEGDFGLGVSNLPVDLELNLKKGAKVIFVKNDINGRWVNGTLGEVEELSKDYIKVRLNENSSIVEVQAVDWEKIKYEYDNNTGRIIAKVIGKLSQIPLKLAWALTIHKCQGQTLDKIHIDISSGVWEYGHVYVALSRCRSLEGIKLRTKIWINDIKVDSRVTDFLKNNLNKIDIDRENEEDEK